MRHSILDKHYTPRVLYHTRSSDFVMGGDTVWSAPAFRASIVAGLFLVLLCSFSTPAIADTATTTSEATWVRGEDGMWMLESSETGGLIVANPIPGVTLHPIADAKVLLTYTMNQEGIWLIQSETIVEYLNPGNQDPETTGSDSDSSSTEKTILVPTNLLSPLIALIGSLFLLVGLVAGADEPTRARVVESLGRFSDLSVTEGPGTLAGNYQRGRIIGFLTAHPGFHLSGMIRALELGNHQAVHHLRTLEQENKVWCRRDGRLLRYYTSEVNREAELSGLPRPVDVKQISDVALMILRTIAEQTPDSPSPTQRELASELKTSQQLISHHLLRLENQGLISRERRGLRTRRILTSEGEKVWAGLQSPSL